MAYQALYRSYRPNSFSEVVGQKHIIQTLRNSIMNNKISHAYIFSGPRGIGKTTVARIFAKAINCENPNLGEPCNECERCLSISKETTTDIIELDAASNNGVDEIRGILEKVNFLPSTLNYKVYIIDEVHMLSLSAFNALLKTLEEPPAHVVFILATTEPHKIPMTIHSRCQRFDFKPLTNQEIKGLLQYVSEKEKIKITEEALNGIAEAAEGGMRDALGMLDQVIAYSDDEITIQDVNNVTGRVSNHQLLALIDSFHQKDVAKSLKIVSEIIESGKEVNRIIVGLIQFCRDILLYQSIQNKGNERLIFVLPEFQELAKMIKRKQIFYYLDVLIDIQNKIKWTTSQKIYLEVGIMKIVNANEEDFSTNTISEQTFNISDIEDRIQQLEVKLNSSIPNMEKRLAHIEEQKHELKEDEALTQTIKQLKEDLSNIKSNQNSKNETGSLEFFEKMEQLSLEIEKIKDQINNAGNHSVDENERNLFSENALTSKPIETQLFEIDELKQMFLGRFEEIDKQLGTLNQKISSNNILENTENSKENNDNTAQLEDIKNNYLSLSEKVSTYMEIVEKLEQHFSSIKESANVSIEDFEDLVRKINNIKEYSFNLGGRIKQVEEIVRKGQFSNKEVIQQENKEPKEIETKPKEKTIETIEVEPTVEEEDNEELETQRVYDIRRIETILHESRELSCRDDKVQIIQQWKHLTDDLKYNLSQVANYLIDGMCVANGKQEILIVFPNAPICNYLMEDSVHFQAKQVLKKALDKDYDFIALPENVWQEIRKEYHGQYQMGTVYPTLKPINNPELRIVKINKEAFNQKTQGEQKAEAIFGKKLLKKEGE